LGESWERRRLGGFFSTTEVVRPSKYAILTGITGFSFLYAAMPPGRPMPFTFYENAPEGASLECDSLLPLLKSQ
jgi:hypothetical protein